MEFLKRGFKSIRTKIEGIKKSGSWKGSIIALLITVLTLFLIQSYHMFYSHGKVDFIKGFIIVTVAIVLVSGVLTLLLSIIKVMPIIYIWVGLSSFLLLSLTFFGSNILITIIFSILMIVIVSIIGNIIYRVIKNYNKKQSSNISILNIFLAVLVLTSVSLGSFWIISDGLNKDHSTNVVNIQDENQYNLKLNDPAKVGEYDVNKLFYGSGIDINRKEYKEEVELITSSVDATAFIENWSFLRRKSLGFGPENIPLNGQVYYPQGKGPFPLVIMVHGNHSMTDYSESGYDYLGNLLASRGYIFVSLDENFLNISPYDDLLSFKLLKEENDARGWLILQHIKQWDIWNGEKNNLFYNKVDMNNIGIIGHSRGGEGVAVAGAFNRLRTYPDDGNIKFDFGYNIKSIIAIAPTEGQYKPMDKPIVLNDVNYLVLQGAHDMDVSSFMGTNQYNRVNFKDKENYFKSSVYIYGANHGQFNESWGRRDGIGLGNNLNNSKQLISKGDQEHITKVFISGFLEATLKNKEEYKILFSDIRYAKNFLPETIYISNYFDGKTRIIANFDEDIDLNSITLSGGYSLGNNFVEWKEERAKSKYGTRENSCLYLKWDKDINTSTGVYTIKLPNEVIPIGEESSIVFTMAEGHSDKKNYEDMPIDLTIKLVDKDGNEGSLPLSSYMYLNPTIKGEIFKWPFNNIINTMEPTFQRFEFDLRDFKDINNNFNIKELSEISLIFDKTSRGSVLIDDIGIKLDKQVLKN